MKTRKLIGRKIVGVEQKRVYDPVFERHVYEVYRILLDDGSFVSLNAEDIFSECIVTADHIIN